MHTYTQTHAHTHTLTHTHTHTHTQHVLSPFCWSSCSAQCQHRQNLPCCPACWDLQTPCVAPKILPETAEGVDNVHGSTHHPLVLETGRQEREWVFCPLCLQLWNSERPTIHCLSNSGRTIYVMFVQSQGEDRRKQCNSHWYKYSMLVIDYIMTKYV